MINIINNRFNIPLLQYYLTFLCSKQNGTAQKQNLFRPGGTFWRPWNVFMGKYAIAMKIYVILELGAQKYPIYCWGLQLYYIILLFRNKKKQKKILANNDQST